MVNLIFLPPTVIQLNLERNLLTAVLGLDKLAGKRLRTLNIRKNPLEIDLKPLVRSPLRYTKFVSVSQKRWYIGI